MTPRVGLVGCGWLRRLILRDLVACGAEVDVVGTLTEIERTLDRPERRP